MVLSKVISAFLIKPSWEYDEMPNNIIIYTTLVTKHVAKEDTLAVFLVLELLT